MYRKRDLPKKDELVICTIKESTPSSVFVTLDEYDKIEGMIHISEISRKFVRSMKTYLKVGAKLVCSVMSFDFGKKFAELSLRRVGEGEKRTKLKEWENEKKANEILEVFAKQNNMTVKEIYDKAGNKILEKFGLLFPTFIEIAKSGEERLISAGLEKTVAKNLTELIQKRIVLPKAEIHATMTIIARAQNGIDVIKKAVADAEEIAKKKKVTINIKYLGAPKYKLKIIADDFKVAEETFKTLSSELEKFIAAHDGTVSIERE